MALQFQLDAGRVSTGRRGQGLPVLVFFLLTLSFGCGSNESASLNTDNFGPGSGSDTAAARAVTALAKESYSPDALAAVQHAIEQAPAPPIISPRLDASASSGLHDYILAGATISSYIPVDDVLRVYVNGSLVYQDPSVYSEDLPPIHFQAAVGDIVNIQAEDYFGFCRGISSPLILYDANSGQSQVLDPDGKIDGCSSGYPPRFTYYNESFTVKIPSKSVEVTSLSATDFDGQSTTLSFDLVPKDITSPDISWTVDVLKEGAVVFQFPISPGENGPGVATDIADGGKHVELVWDAKDSSGTLVEGDVDYEVHATACETSTGGGSGGGSNCVTGDGSLMASIAGQLILEVVADNAVIGSSEDTDSPKPEGIDRLQKIFHYNRSGQSSSWTVRARSVVFDSSVTPVPPLKVAVEGTVSNTTLNLELKREGTTNTFSATRNDILSQVVRQNVSGTAYTAADGFSAGINSDGSVADRIFSAIGNLGVLPVYPTPRMGVGRYNQGLASGRPRDEYVKITTDNLKDFGFEPVRVTVDPAQNPGLQTNQPVKAVVKVRNPAKLVALTLHGDHEGKLSTTSAIRQTVLSPDVLSSEDVASVKTLILASCNVLDLHDYNNNYVNQPNLDPTRTSAQDPVSLRFSPGKLWWSATRRNQTTLLGYSFPVVGAAANAGTLNYFTELNRLNGVVSSDRLEVYAWLSAHRKIFPQLKNSFPQVLTACAWDSNSYYFISYSHKVVQATEQDIFREKRALVGVYRIPLSSGDNTVTNFQSPPSGGGVELVEIP